jgi:hypothetical protein
MRYSVKRKLNVDRTPHICDLCGKECIGLRSLKSHKTQMHCGSKDTSNRGRPKGIPAWNKGIRSKPDTRNPDLIGSHGGYRPNAGVSKKFSVIDSFGNTVCLQSTYELTCSEILNSLGIKWIRPKHLKYGNKKYFADFYLTDFDIYLDPKNDYKAELDKEKIDEVIKENNVKVVVLTLDKLNEEYIKMLCC